MLKLYYSFSSDSKFNNSAGVNLITLIRIPFLSFTYLHIARITYIFLLKKEPITINKSTKKGEYNYELNREVNQHDRNWTAINLLIGFLLIFYFYIKA